MEPITTTIVAALVAGSVAAARDVATSAIKDAYQGLRRLIMDRYDSAKVPLEALEAEPDSNHKQAALAKNFDSAGIAKDSDVRAAAQALLDAVEELRGVDAAAPLFDFGRLRATRNIELTDIEALGTVFRAHDAEVLGDFRATGIRQKPARGSTEKK